MTHNIDQAHFSGTRKRIQSTEGDEVRPFLRGGGTLKFRTQLLHPTLMRSHTFHIFTDDWFSPASIVPESESKSDSGLESTIRVQEREHQIYELLLVINTFRGWLWTRREESGRDEAGILPFVAGKRRKGHKGTVVDVSSDTHTHTNHKRYVTRKRHVRSEIICSSSP